MSPNFRTLQNLLYALVTLDVDNKSLLPLGLDQIYEQIDHHLDVADEIENVLFFICNWSVKKSISDCGSV
jgi:hypothetical protein